MANNDATQVNRHLWTRRASTAVEQLLSNGRGAFRYEFNQLMDSGCDGLMRGHGWDEDQARGWIVMDILERRLRAERLKVWHALADARKEECRDLTDACLLLNHVVSVVVGYHQAIVLSPVPCDDPVVLGRAEERLECFLEETDRTVRTIIPMVGLQHPLAWDERKFELRPTLRNV